MSKNMKNDESGIPYTLPDLTNVYTVLHTQLLKM